MPKRITTSQLIKLPKPEKTYDINDSEVRGLHVKVRPSGNHSYCFRYRNNAGKQQTVTIGRTDTLKPAQARERALKLAVQANDGVDVQKEKRAKKAYARAEAGKTVRAYMESKDYQQHLDQRSARSAREALLTIKKHFGHLMERPLAELTPKDVQNWRAKKRKDKLAESTIQRVETELKLLVNRAIEDKWLNHNPLSDLKPLKQSTLTSETKLRHLSPKEHKAIRQALRARDKKKKQKAASGDAWRIERGLPTIRKAQGYYFDHLEPMVLLSLNTGMRRGELFSLEWQDVDLANKVITLRAATTKAKKSRGIQLNPEAMDTLKHWRKQTGGNRLVFSNKGGQFDNVKKAWGRLLSDAKIANFRWHDMRHTFASDLVMAGAQLNTIRDLLGHADLKMTLRYAHLSDSSKADAVALIGTPIDDIH